FGELVDPILRDFQPITDADLFAGIVRELSDVLNLSYWHFVTSSLCNLCVLGVSVVLEAAPKVHHRGTVDTEVAQRRPQFCKFSKTVAAPCPPPTHIVTMP